MQGWEVLVVVLIATSATLPAVMRQADRPLGRRPDAVVGRPLSRMRWRQAGGDRRARPRRADAAARGADALSLSARGYHRSLRVARKLADLDGEDAVACIHIAEALSHRGETLRRAQVAT